MEKKHEVTIYDIAKALNLSTSTISRALSGSGFVQDQTRSKVARTATELGYTRNVLASRLRSQKCQLLGTWVTHLNTPFSSSIVAGAETAATQVGYNLLLNQSMNKSELRLRNIENLKSQRVDGILVNSAYGQELESVEELAKLGKPIVAVEASSFLPSPPKKKINDFQNAHELTAYLIEKGCKRVAFLSANLNKSRHKNFLSGFQEALQHHHLPQTEQPIKNNLQADGSWNTVCETFVSMTPRPDGIIFTNNSITSLVFRATECLGNSDVFWLTCRKSTASMRSHTLLELGKFAATLLICLNESRSTRQNEFFGKHGKVG